MKVALVSYSDLEGGAAKSAYRLHQGLREINIESFMFVQRKKSEDLSVLGPTKKTDLILSYIQPSLDFLPLKFSRKDKVQFSPAWVISQNYKKVKSLNADIVNLHWINKGLLRVEDISKFNCPVVWTLHDMWSFTGGCHYALDCKNYEARCGKCPQLNSKRMFDLSRWVWIRKHTSWKTLNLTIVCPSKWLATSAQKSALLSGKNIFVIPYGIDTTVYKPFDRNKAREWLNLPHDKKLILFSAIHATRNPLKGFSDLKDALTSLSSTWKDNVEVVITGASKDERNELPLRTHYLGTINDEYLMGLIYNAVDLLVFPSIQDNLPNTILEAGACGIPCVAYKVGGIPEIIKHLENGFLTEKNSFDGLIDGIEWMLAKPEALSNFSDRIRKFICDRFTLKHQANQYRDLFLELLKSGN